MNTLTITLPDGIEPPDKLFGLGETFVHMFNEQVQERTVSHIAFIKIATSMMTKYYCQSNGVEQAVHIRDMYKTREELARAVFGEDIIPKVITREQEEENRKYELLQEIKLDLGLNYAGGDESIELLEAVYLAWIRGKHGAHSTKYRNVTERSMHDVVLCRDSKQEQGQ